MKRFYSLIIFVIYFSVAFLTFTKSETIHKGFYFGEEMIVQMVHPINTETNCLKPIMDFRCIHKNGEVKSFQIDFPFPEYNFCPDPNGLYGFDVYYLVSKTLFIKYVNPTDASFYGMTIDMEGNIKRFVIILNSIKKEKMNLF